MAGHSATPLPKKLGLKQNLRIGFHNLPREVKTELKNEIAGCVLGQNGPLDYGHIFATSCAELKKQFATFARRLTPAGMLWVSWPKKSSGVATDLDENQVRSIGLEAGLVDVKVCAVTDVWSGLKFVIRVKDRKEQE